MKNVLMVSYYSPPYAGVSVVRVKKYCKYLPEYNWQPWVFTVDPRYYAGKIVDDLEDIRNTKTIRIPYYKVPGKVFLVKLFFPFLVAAFSLKNKSKLKAVYLTGSPFHPFLLTVFLTGIFRIPTILDFRDSWSFNHGFDGRNAGSLKEKISEVFIGSIEKLSIKFASKVTFSTHILHEEYSNRYSEYRHKFKTITNGYDPDDFISVKPRKVVNTKSIILTGKFKIYTPEVVYGIFEAVKALNNFTFIYVGGESEELIELAKEYGIENKIVSLPYMPYSDSLDLIAGADYAMMTNGMVNGTGTKIFDYLALKKPVICFVPEGSIISHQFSDIDHIVIKEGPHTNDSILDGLEKLFSIKTAPSENAIKEYSRIYASQDLAKILNEIIAMNP